MKSDLQKYIAARKRRDPQLASGFDAGYEEFKLGILLRQAREQAGLTQDALAKRSRTSKTTIAKIETNAEETPISTIDRVARALGKTLKVELVESS